MSGYNHANSRNRPPESVRSFEQAVTVGSLADIPSGCLCTWVPAPGGPTMDTDRSGYTPDERQPWLATVFALKFINTTCPVGRLHR